MSELIPDLHRSARPAPTASQGFRPYSRLAARGESMCGDISVLTDRVSQERLLVVCDSLALGRLRDGGATMDCHLFGLPVDWNA